MLSPIQKEIVELPGNLIVRASAGTGKTHTMVSKIEYDIAHCHTHKAVAAITFTITIPKKNIAKKYMKQFVTLSFILRLRWMN